VTDPRAIGVFDSGVGGLTVLHALLEHLPDEPTVYLGDTARVPYGTRGADVVTRYALNNARTLLAATDLKLLIVACNTASAVALPALVRELPVPVLGVIEPGARAAIETSRGGSVLVLGTAGTVRSLAYPRALEAWGFAGDVHSRACPLLVPLVEEGWTESEVTDRVLDHYLEGIDPDVAAVVLGCTHYPLLRPAIERALERATGRAVPVVDGAQATAREAKTLLSNTSALRESDGPAPRRRFLVTDSPEQMSFLAPRFLGRPLLRDQVELVDVLMTAP
jgi:glutamate racemase